MTIPAPFLSQGPLAGITVIDMTHVLSGPYATLILRHLGARVIKIERPCFGDDARSFGPFMEGKSTYFQAINGGKESIVIDLDKEDDRHLLHKLLTSADMLVENFRPGVLQRYELDYVSLHRLYPRLIYGSVTGFGQTGPYRNRPAYDIVVQAMSGLMSVTGQPGGRPTRAGVSIGDMAAGLYLAIGLCAAIYERTLTGGGRYIDVAMFDCQVALLENLLADYTATGVLPQPLGTQHPSIAPFSVFRAVDTSMVIAAANDSLFNKLCCAVERQDLLQDRRFHTNELRHKHVAALTLELERTLSTKSARQWIDCLQRAGVPCGPVNTLDEVIHDSQLAARGMILPISGDATGQLRIAGNPIKMDGVTDAALALPSPDLDADRDRLIHEFSGTEAHTS